MRLRYLIVVAMVVLYGCAGAQGTPEAAKEAGYPQSGYMTATGLGQSEGEARNQAVAELSRVFESRVSSDTLDRVRLVAGSTGEEYSEQRIDSRIRVMSGVELKGVEVVKAWRQNGTHYALAVLERHKARDNWLREMRDLDRRIEGRVEALSSIESRLLRYKALQKISAVWIEREVIVSRLRVLGFDEGSPAGYDMRDVFRQLSETKAGMLLYVTVAGIHGGTVRERISEELGRAGFVLASSRRTADVLVEGKVEVRPVELGGSDLKYARAVVSLAVSDANAGVSAGEVTEDKRGAHLFYPQAVEKALDKVLNSVSMELFMLLEEAEGGEAGF
jgi:hypothetical protein